MSGRSSERRRTPRAPAHGTCVLHGDHGVLYGKIENLSLGGVLVSVASAPRWETDRDPGTLDIELKFGAGRPVVARGSGQIDLPGPERPFAATGRCWMV